MIKKTIYKNKRIKLETLDGQKYAIPYTLYYILKEAKSRSENKLDNIIVVSGSVGSGKSNLNKVLCGTWEEHFHKRKFTLDQTHFLIEHVMDQLYEQGNETRAINFDEAVQGGTAKDGISKVGFALRKALITKRKKRHLITLAIDNPKELNDKIIERCVAWFHVFYYRTKDGKYIKGLFKIFSPKELHIVYDDLKNKRVRFVENHWIYKEKNTVGNLNNYSKLFYSEEEYDKKKDIQTSALEDDSRESKSIRQRDTLIKFILDNKFCKGRIIAETTDMPYNTIKGIYKKMNDESKI